LVTMGCGEACPYIPGLKKIDWPLPDPKAQPVNPSKGFAKFATRFASASWLWLPNETGSKPSRQNSSRHLQVPSMLTRLI